MTKEDAKAISRFSEFDIEVTGKGTCKMSGDEFHKLKLAISKIDERFKIVITGFIIDYNE